MTIQVGKKVSIGQKEIKTKYPFQTGLIAGTTKQEGRKINVPPEQGSLVPLRKKVGL